MNDKINQIVSFSFGIVLGLVSCSLGLVLVDGFMFFFYSLHIFGLQTLNYADIGQFIGGHASGLALLMLALTYYEQSKSNRNNEEYTKFEKVSKVYEKLKSKQKEISVFYCKEKERTDEIIFLCLSLEKYNASGSTQFKEIENIIVDYCEFCDYMNHANFNGISFKIPFLISQSEHMIQAVRPKEFIIYFKYLTSQHNNSDNTISLLLKHKWIKSTLANDFLNLSKKGIFISSETNDRFGTRVTVSIYNRSLINRLKENYELTEFNEECFYLQQGCKHSEEIESSLLKIREQINKHINF